MFMLPQPTDGFAWVQAPPGPALVCRALEPLASHLFTTRGWTLGSPTDGTADEAWDQVAVAVEVDAARLVRARQVHGSAVIVRRAGQAHQADAAIAANERPAADLLTSNDSTLALAIQTADCVQILLADRRTGAVAAAHAGWRGLAAGVPAAVVDALAREFGCRAEDLVAAAGPSISAPRYEVGADVRDAFQAAGRSAAELARWFSPSPRADHWQFDGWAAVRDQLASVGVPARQIHVAALCTATYPDLFCSYRRDGSPAGRMAAVVRARVTTPPRPSQHP
jgi:YfiH family protein